MTPEQEAIKSELRPNVSKVNNWLTPEGLALLEGLSRNGYGEKEIAKRIGISRGTLRRWAERYEAIDEVLRRGREISDYMVENALFKSALGYRTKEVSIKTKMENGIVTEVTKDVSFRDQQPNMRAIEIWLYNRKPDLWKRDGGNRLDELIEDSSIQITVNRGLPEEDKKQTKQSEWPEEINDDITINKPTDNESKTKGKVKLNDDIEISTDTKPKRESSFDKYNNERRIKNALPSDNIHVDREQALDEAVDTINNSHYPNSSNKDKAIQEDLDEWPDDWEELINITNNEEGE